MIIRVDLQSVFARTTAFLLALGCAALLTKAVFAEFVAGTLADTTAGTNRQLLISAVQFLPDSARLAAKLAEDEASGSNANLENAETNAARAARLSPHDYNYRLLLAQIREARGNSQGAEQSLAEALKLAPNYSEVHWRTANLLVRTGKIEAAVEHFSVAVRLNLSLLPATLALVRTVSNDDVSALKKIAGDNPKAQLKLALFLAQHSRFAEAGEVFAAADKSVALAAWESSAFFDLLIVPYWLNSPQLCCGNKEKDFSA